MVLSHRPTFAEQGFSFASSTLLSGPSRVPRQRSQKIPRSSYTSSSLPPRSKSGRVIPSYIMGMGAPQIPPLLFLISSCNSKTGGILTAKPAERPTYIGAWWETKRFYSCECLACLFLPSYLLYHFSSLKVLHVPADGRALLTLFDAFMKKLVSSQSSRAITWGDETSRLPNPFAVAYGLWKEDQQPTAEFWPWIQSVGEKTSRGS